MNSEPANDQEDAPAKSQIISNTIAFWKSLWSICVTLLVGLIAIGILSFYSDALNVGSIRWIKAIGLVLTALFAVFNHLEKPHGSDNKLTQRGKLLLHLMVLAAVFGVGAMVVEENKKIAASASQHEQTSKQLEQMEVILKQLQAQSERTRQVEINTEIANEITSLNLILLFNEPLSVADFKNEVFLASLQGERRNYPYLETLAEVTHVGAGPNETALNLFCEFKSSFGDRGRNTHTHGAGTAYWDQTIRELPIPFSIRQDRDKPFVFVRDLEESQMQIFLPPRLTNRVVRIDIAVNSSRGLYRRLIVLSKAISPSDWMTFDYDPRSRFWGGADEHKIPVSMLKASLSNVSWSINLQKAKWDDQTVNFLEGFRVPYMFAPP